MECPVRPGVPQPDGNRSRNLHLDEQHNHLDTDLSEVEIWGVINVRLNTGLAVPQKLQ